MARAALGIMDAPGAQANPKRWLTPAAWVAAGLLPLIAIDPVTYLVLTVAGITMGMLIFLAASGLTLVFGLLDVLNLAHGAFFVWGAYAGYSVLNLFNTWGWVETGGPGQSLVSLVLALIAALIMGGLWGLVIERVIVRKVYGDHLKQILITMGVSLVLAEIIKVVWGPNDEVVLVPQLFVGSYDLWDVIINKFRVVAIVVGLIVYASMELTLRRTKLGIIVRAGVENREVVQALGHNIHHVFTWVFVAGAGLAAVGGSMWSIFKEQIHPGMGEENLIYALIVVMVGGMGSVTGCFLGAMIVGLAFNYVAYLMPTLALGVNILIMFVVLLSRPTGLMGRD